MTKKKKASDGEAALLSQPSPPPSVLPSFGTKASNGKAEQHHSSLTISRNKHWRYISAFHGPWLQLPHEILETLAHTNYLSPRPRQTDPGVLFDILKIRRLVDEASDLTVRAQNGTASSALVHADNGLPGSAFGLSYRGGGGNAKLSPERKYRMRELATQKLSQAYRLDEIAASVATMQSASTLDSVAGLVLQRAPSNMDAKYVHFFHEKIPSRMMAECTPLTPLNDVITFEQGHAAPYRTRALTRIFKEDYAGAVRDLTEALQLCRLDQAKHKASKNQLITLETAREESERKKNWTRDWMQDNKVSEEDQPRGLEMQLLFQRGNQYLTIACQYIRVALEHFKNAQRQQEQDVAAGNGDDDARNAPCCKSSAEMEAYIRGLEAREALRKNAKRALRDYTAFFSHLDYAHAQTNASDQAIFSNENSLESYDGAKDTSHSVDELEQESVMQSKALIRQSTTHQRRRDESILHPMDSHCLPTNPVVHDIATLLSASPPADLPPYPLATSLALTTRCSKTTDGAFSEHTEMITYHPLMPETLHSLLLTHCLLQTPPTTLLRLSNNVARLARLADGYPFFLSARSPARADWSEIVRKTGNWIGLTATWETLCKAPSTPGLAGTHTNGREKEDVRENAGSAYAKVDDESREQRRDRIHKEAVMEALGDERVVDDDTFQRAVEAREKRAWRDIEAEERGVNALATPRGSNGTRGSTAEPMGRGRNGHVGKDEEYLIGTERAEAISKWVIEAPTVVEVMGKSKKKKKGTRSTKRFGLDGGSEAGTSAVENGTDAVNGGSDEH